MRTERVSSYVIPIKLEKGNGKYILIHGYTGAIDIVNESVVLKLKDNNVNDFSENTLQALRERGYITSKTKEEEIEYVKRIAKALHCKASKLYKTFTIIVTYNCNFRCPYCFEGREKKDSIFQLAMTPNMVDKAFNAMEKIEPNKQLRCKTIELYGGEPLLKQNKGIVEYIVNKGYEKGYKFRVITNGYDLDYFIDLLSSELIEGIQITIDGTKDYHNQRRVHYLYGKTFDKIVSNVQKALEKEIKVDIRVNNDTQNIADFSLLRNYFESAGFFSFNSFRMYSTLLWDSDSISIEEKQKLDFLSSQKYIQKHKEMGTLAMCKDNGIFYQIYQSLHKGNPILFRDVFCSSQIGGYVFDPLGDIYPCWEIVGNKKFRIGTYQDDNLEWDNESLEEWRSYDITSNSICKTCKYALYCGGGCVVHAILGKREHCSYFKMMFEFAVNRAFESTI